jgi:hypothetical protein
MDFGVVLDLILYGVVILDFLKNRNLLVSTQQLEFPLSQSFLSYYDSVFNTTHTFDKGKLKLHENHKFAIFLILRGVTLEVKE